jgi:outer membrane protein OmpA-like peptidoglycan-associated protein
MRQFCLVMTALLATAASAVAQVTVDLHALDALPGAKTQATAPHARPSEPKSPPRIAAKKPPQPSPAPNPETATPSTPTVALAQPGAQPEPNPSPPVTAPPSPPPPPATLPTAAPPTVALAPIAPPQPTEPEPPPPPPPISDTAASTATNTSAGLRVTFGSGQADLSPSSAAAIKSLVTGAPPGLNISFNVAAYAAGTPEDPSTARRLSLSRALAVRSALMADGVSSTRIYVRALGAASGDEPPDRVDVAVLGGNASATDASAKSRTQ